MKRWIEGFDMLAYAKRNTENLIWTNWDDEAKIIDNNDRYIEILISRVY